jgi:hypothetical protein
MHAQVSRTSPSTATRKAPVKNFGRKTAERWDSNQEIDGVGAIYTLSASSANSKLSGGFNITSSDIGGTGWDLYTGTLTGATNRLVVDYKGTN